MTAVKAAVQEQRFHRMATMGYATLHVTIRAVVTEV
jgi:hypothetical protein